MAPYYSGMWAVQRKDSDVEVSMDAQIVWAQMKSRKRASGHTLTFGSLISADKR